MGDKEGREYTEVYQKITTHAVIYDRFTFVNLNDKECATSYGAQSTPALMIFRKFDTSPLLFEGNWEVDPIVDWLKAATIPTVIEL